MLIMFCLDPTHPLYNGVVDIVSQRPGISVKELHEELEDKLKAKVTLQHLYRVVNRLTEEQVMLKKRGKLTLNLMWLGQVELFAKQAKQRLTQPGMQQTQLPLTPGTQVDMQCQTLSEVQATWYHMLVQIRTVTPPEDKEVFKYYSHAWWLNHEAEDHEDFYRRIAERGLVCYWLYGNDTYLDRRAARMHKDLFKSKIADRPPFPAEGYCINVHGEYVLECLFPQKISKHFESIFSSVESEKDFDSDVIRDVFTLKAPYVIKLRRDTSRARELADKIRRFF